MSKPESLLQQIEKRIREGKIELPPASRISQRLQEISRQPDFDLQETVTLITEDTALSAEILRVANSSFYGGLTEITTIKDAVIRLGGQETSRLAILVIEKNNYRVDSPLLREYLQPLWEHAQATATGARWLALNLDYENLGPEAFLAGLFHDFGKLLLVKILDEILRENPEQPALAPNLIREVMQSAHCEQGFTLARQWDLPERYCEIIRDHHNEDLSPADTLMNLVCLVNKTCRQLGIGLDHDPSITLAASDEAVNLDASDLKLAQLAIMLEDQMAPV